MLQQLDWWWRERTGGGGDGDAGRGSEWGKQLHTEARAATHTHTHTHHSANLKDSASAYMLRVPLGGAGVECCAWASHNGFLRGHADGQDLLQVRVALDDVPEGTMVVLESRGGGGQRRAKTEVSACKQHVRARALFPPKEHTRTVRT